MTSVSSHYYVCGHERWSFKLQSQWQGRSKCLRKITTRMFPVFRQEPCLIRLLISGPDHVDSTTTTKSTVPPRRQPYNAGRFSPHRNHPADPSRTTSSMIGTAASPGRLHGGDAFRGLLLFRWMAPQPVEIQIGSTRGRVSATMLRKDGTLAWDGRLS